MTMATKAALSGLWRIDRRIEDARGPDGRFTGTLHCQSIDASPATLRLHEAGTLKIGDQAPVSATRRYEWVFSTPTLVNVRFADGRPFHAIDLTSQTPVAYHHCPPDHYNVAYDFELPVMWRTTWRVTGPRKDYVMTSVMIRQETTRHDAPL